MSKQFATMEQINDPLRAASRDDCEVVLAAIEALKRWIYGNGYRGPQKQPLPGTEDEFSALMDGLRRWATLNTPQTDTGRLQDYRRAEFSLPVPWGPARVFPAQPVEREWKRAAARADDALNELKILLQERVQKSPEKRRMTRKEANEKGKELARQRGKEFFLLSGRKQAQLIGCSWQTWVKTDLYRTASKRQSKPRSEKRAPPRPAVSFSHNLEAVVGEGSQNDVLNQLIAEQQADQEPSPLDESRPRKVYSRKRL